MSLCVRKPTICMGENKDADQLRGNREADQRLCFRYTDSTFPPLLIPKLSRFYVSSLTVQAGLCWTWLKTQIVGFSCTGSYYNESMAESCVVHCLAIVSDFKRINCVTATHHILLCESETHHRPSFPVMSDCFDCVISDELLFRPRQT